MFHFAIPVAIILAIKAYFIAHGLTISVAALEAGYRAHTRGGDADDIIDAAIAAGATRAAAVLLSDAIKKVL